jgi:hypothetical protein
MLCIFSSNLWLQFCVLGYCAKILCFLLIACEIFKEKNYDCDFGKKNDYGGIIESEKRFLFLKVSNHIIDLNP